MALAGRSVIDKAIAIIFPISAFVAAGFEHSIANMYFIPMGILLKLTGQSTFQADAVTWVGFLHNIVPVILGNIVGGSILVGLVYFIIYRRGTKVS
jgi:formate/nitrite transporter FocA (FNT family)